MTDKMIYRFTEIAFQAAAVLALLVAPVSAAEPPSHYALVQSTLEKSIAPGFVELSKNAARLPDAVAHVCVKGDDASRKEAADAFRATVLSWAGVEYLRFGPLADGGKRERMSFWPDPRGIMNRQLRQLIASHDLKVIEDGALAKQSAAVQGLPALEVLLTDKENPLGPGDASAFSCKLAAAMATNIKSVSQELLDDWTKAGGWRDKMLRPGSDNASYKEPQEAASELVKALLVGFQLVADSQVKPRLDDKTSATFAGPFAKSNLTKDYFQAGVASLGKLYDAMALESYLSEDKSWVKDWAGGAWRNLKASDGAGGSADASNLADPPPARKVFDMLSGLRKLAAAEMSVAAGLTVGFNELDGD
jgi:uncharacterized protein